MELQHRSFQRISGVDFLRTDLRLEAQIQVVRAGDRGEVGEHTLRSLCLLQLLGLQLLLSWGGVVRVSARLPSSPPLLSSLLRTLVGARLRLNNLGQSHLEILNYVCKSLFPWTSLESSG